MGTVRRWKALFLEAWYAEVMERARGKEKRELFEAKKKTQKKKKGSLWPPFGGVIQGRKDSRDK